MNKKNLRKNILYLAVFYIISFLFFYHSSNPNNKINLKFNEINTEYENKDSLEALSYVDTSWHWPTDSNYYLTSSYSNYHSAIDIVSNTNLDIYSAYQGEVITNSYKNDNGNYLVIKQDNGYYVLYAHLSKKLVNQGDKVEKGQIIGIMGRTGYATGVHLHFSVWNGYPHNSTPVNPLNFLLNFNFNKLFIYN